MIAPDQISAVLVTRGDVDLNPVIAALPQAYEVIIWDDRERGSQGCYGRYLAAAEATRPVIYFQDDDLIFREHRRLRTLFEPDRMVVNMPSPWYENCGYDRLGQALVGAGSLVPRALPLPALEFYLDRYPADERFLTYCDVVVGMLTPHRRVDLGYQVLPYASAQGRIYTRPGAAAQKAEMQQRMLALRDEWQELVGEAA